ncbi:maturase [Canna indica]|uniref:Maturase (Mitochondrion) n=1 Tax=Canna indica TaxID=4628 RepID=A0AAQ3JRH8_9LILI|nr:maturase [Canna indica]
MPFVFPPSTTLAAFLNKPSSLLCAAFLIEAARLTPKAEFYGREGFNKNLAMRNLIKYCKRRGLLIELGGKAILVIRSERGLALPTIRPEPLGRLRRINNHSCTKYGRIPRYDHSGSPSEDNSHTILARAREASMGKAPYPYNCLPATLRHQFQVKGPGSRIPIKHLTKGMSGRGHLLDAIQLAPTLGTAGVKSPQISVLWGTVKHIRQGSREISLLHSSGRSNVPSDVQQAVSRSGMSVRKFSLYTPAGRKAAGEGGGHWAGSFSNEFPIQIKAPIKKILRRLRDRGLISRRRPRPIHVASLMNVSDEDIVNWFADIAISLLSYYRCCDNLYHVRTIVDHQIRWSAIFTPAHKHKSSAWNIIPKYPKDSNIVNQEGGKTLAEFPNSIELGKLGPGQDPNNDGALHYMFDK